MTASTLRRYSRQRIRSPCLTDRIQVPSRIPRSPADHTCDTRWHTTQAGTPAPTRAHRRSASLALRPPNPRTVLLRAESYRTMPLANTQCITISLHPESISFSSTVSRSRQRLEVPQPAASRSPAAGSVSNLLPRYGVNACVQRGIPISSGVGSFFVRPYPDLACPTLSAR
jgi:hypothetical protein